MQLGCIVIHPRVNELSRIHGFCTSSFSFEVWLHHGTSIIIVYTLFLKIAHAPSVTCNNRYTNDTVSVQSSYKPNHMVQPGIAARLVLTISCREELTHDEDNIMQAYAQHIGDLMKDNILQLILHMEVYCSKTLLYI